MEKMVWTLVLLTAVWSGVAAITVTIPQAQYEYARGDNITLPCTFKSTITTPSQVVINWIALAQVDGAIDDDVITYYNSPPETDVGSGYDGRAFLDLDMASGKANLKLNSITLNDNREFECKVQIPKDGKGQPAAKTRLVVLVAPSTPVCKVQGKAEYGQNINLTCASAEGSPPPTYSWAGYDVNNRPRAPDPKTTDKGGILSLFNITKDTSGFYICTSVNKIRSATCNYTLSVLPPSMNIASTGAIIGGVIAALILLVIIIYCCCCKNKKKGAEEEYTMGVHEDEYHDKEPINGDSRRADGQESAIRVDEQKTERSSDRPKDYDDRRSDYDDRRSDYDDKRSDYNDRRSDYDRRKDYDDRRSDYDDRRSDYDDRRSDYNDRRKDYDDRRSDYDDRRSDYDDRRKDYDDRRSDYDDRRNKYGDRRERYEDDRRYDNDRRDPRSDRP